MDWIEVKVHTLTEASDAVSELLVQLGSSGTMVEDRADVPDPDHPSGYWEIIDPKMIESMPEDVVVHAWFQPDASFRDRMQALHDGLRTIAGAFPDAGSLRVESDQVHDEDWSEVWKQFYKPFRAGKRLVVCPTWESYDAAPDDLVISMDPGMAFGSGTHETTGMCLQLMEDIVTEHTRVMDVGTGSGILAIGAALLGARDVLAIDIDPQAVKVCEENVVLNGVSSQVTVMQGDLLKGHEDAICDVCIANIIADIILLFAEPLKAHITPGGYFLCSGIIRERGDEVEEGLVKAGYTILRREERGEWNAFLCRRT